MDRTAIWVTIGIYIVLMVIIGITQGKKAKSIADLTVGGRNAGAWLSALSYGTAYFSAVMFVGYAGGTGKGFGLWGVLAGLGNAVFGSWLAWKVLARRTRDTSYRLKLKTMPQFLDKRYSSPAMKLLHGQPLPALQRSWIQPWKNWEIFVRLYQKLLPMQFRLPIKRRLPCGWFPAP
mgnify:CR=1 FL=1